MRTHQAAPVSVAGQSAEVDLELVPLITEVWRAGITTIHSCQDVGENVAGLVAELPHLEAVARREAGRASIGFADVAGLEAFHRAVADGGPRDELYERASHWATADAWQCVIGLQERGPGCDHAPTPEVETGASRLEAVSFQVRFPRSDIGPVTDRLRRHRRPEQQEEEDQTVPSINGIHHISFSVTDPDRSATWYQDVLGFAHHSEVEGPRFRRIRLRHPDGGLIVTLTGHRRGSGDPFSELRTGLDHVAFAVADGEIEVWKRRFEELGVEHAETRPNGLGGGTIALRDPDGIQLEVFASGSEQRRPQR